VSVKTSPGTLVWELPDQLWVIATDTAPFRQVSTHWRYALVLELPSARSSLSTRPQPS
jgi:hypothetical protein